MKKHLLLFLLLPTLAFAQTAAELDVLMETETVTVGEAARFTLGSAGLLPPELSGAAARDAAYEEAQSRGWVRSGQGDDISLQETAFLLMNAFGIKGGIMYTAVHNPRYAYREMVYRKLIQGRAYSSMKVSGQRLLQLIGMTLNYTGEREQMDDIIMNSEAPR